MQVRRGRPLPFDAVDLVDRLRIELEVIGSEILARLPWVVRPGGRGHVAEPVEPRQRHLERAGAEPLGDSAHLADLAHRPLHERRVGDHPVPVLDGAAAHLAGVPQRVELGQVGEQRCREPRSEGVEVGARRVARATIARFERIACTPKMAAEIMIRDLEIDVRPLLPSLTMPTLVPHAVGDPIVPIAGARYLASTSRRRG